MLYNLLRILLYIPILILCIFSSKKRKFIHKRFFQNYKELGKGKDYLWIHCSSVGEINLSDSLIKKLLIEKKENILISMFTDTGYETAKNKYKGNKRIKIIFFPLDDYIAINQILKRINLKYLFIVETEIWPNLINIVAKKSKIILVNGRISDKSYKKYVKFKSILKGILSGKIDTYYMQTKIDRDRIIFLGATPEKVFIVGNLKFDIELENYSLEEKEQLKTLIEAKDKKIFVCGSTRTGEYDIILDTYLKLNNYKLVLVPRHLERVPLIEKILEKRGILYKKYSEIEELADSSPLNYKVLIVDKMGLLRKFYSIADITFVGGTLVNVGGHSLLEPLFYKKTPIFGKYTQNIKDIAKEVLKRKIGYQVKTSDEMFLAIEEINKKNQIEKEINEFLINNSHVAEKITKNL